MDWATQKRAFVDIKSLQYKLSAWRRKFEQVQKLDTPLYILSLVRQKLSEPDKFLRSAYSEEIAVELLRLESRLFVKYLDSVAHVQKMWKNLPPGDLFCNLVTAVDVPDVTCFSTCSEIEPGVAYILDGPVGRWSCKTVENESFNSIYYTSYLKISIDYPENVRKFHVY